MGFQKFRIEVLENPILAYAPGVTITGQVHLVTVEECKTGGSTQDLISSGDHVYRFGFKLPQGLPTSFVNKEVKVRYETDAIMEWGWKPNAKARVPFTITGSLDLNKITGKAERVGFRVTMNLSSFFCTKGMVGFEVAIPKQGFVCGEYIEFNAEMFNQGRKYVHGFLASLVQVLRQQIVVHTLTKQGCKIKVI